MNESVMAIYGITRLLKSRDLGPSHLLPALESFREEAQRHRVSVQPMFAGLRAAAEEAGALSDAVDALEPAARTAAEQIIEAFRGPFKLGARQRLQLERDAERLGAELEAVRGLADVLHASLRARPVYVTPADLLHGRWHSSVTFVTQRVEVRLGEGVGQGFMAEPRVVRALFDHVFRTLAASGHARLVVDARETDAGIELEIGPNGDGDAIVEIGLGPTLTIESAVLAPAMKLLGIQLSARAGRSLLTLSA